MGPMILCAHMYIKLLVKGHAKEFHGMYENFQGTNISKFGCLHSDLM
jgi:hypothetical protein